jgi:hypothetical protein
MNQLKRKRSEIMIAFERSFAGHEKAKYWSKKNKENPRDVFKSSDKKYWFDCECGHEFDASLNDINKGKWCSYCGNQKLCKNNECNICYEKSFASHEKVKYWSKKNDENPRDVFKSSHKKYLFDCECGHEFDASLSDINKGNWCSYCGNPPKKLCKNNECNSCYKKSFASHEKAKYWSKKNKENPRDVFKGSDKKYWFDCDCGHEFDASLSKITSDNTWCSYCSNPPKKLCKNNECNSCYEKSFASHEKAKYWSKKNEENPRDVFKNSHKKYWFDCDCGHEFNARLSHITSDNRWCPYCPNKNLCKNNECNSCYEKPILPLIMDSVQYQGQDFNSS